MNPELSITLSLPSSPSDSYMIINPIIPIPFEFFTNSGAASDSVQPAISDIPNTVTSERAPNVAFYVARVLPKHHRMSLRL